VPALQICAAFSSPAFSLRAFSASSASGGGTAAARRYCSYGGNADAATGRRGATVADLIATATAYAPAAPADTAQHRTADKHTFTQLFMH